MALKQVSSRVWVDPDEVIGMIIDCSYPNMAYLNLKLRGKDYYIDQIPFNSEAAAAGAALEIVRAQQEIKR